MPSYIIHHEGAFNMYTTIADGACFESALTREQLEHWYQQEFGRNGMHDLPERIERAIAKGCSAHIESSLESCIQCNCEGLGLEDFIAKYLTLTKEEEGGRDG